MPCGWVDPAVKAVAADALQGGRGAVQAGALGWDVRRLDVGWLPALAPTTRGVYEDEDGSRAELMAAGDLPGMADIASLPDGPSRSRWWAVPWAGAARGRRAVHDRDRLAGRA